LYMQDVLLHSNIIHIYYVVTSFVVHIFDV